jgi:glycosyltransferase involved in cell wall biosynthesis
MSSVLIATQHLEPTGGVGVHVLRSAAALRADGQRVDVAAGRVAADAGAEGVHELPGLEARTVDPRVLVAIERLAGELPGPVVTHLHHIWDVALVLRLQRFGPVVWHVHEFAACPTGEYHFEPGHECHRAHGPGCFPHILFHGCAHTWNLASVPRRYRSTAANIRIMEVCDGVVAYSEFIARHVRRNGIRDVTVVPLIVPAVPGWTTPPDEDRVLFAGRLAPNKGLQTLLAAVRDIDVNVDVVGAGWWRPKAERLTDKLRVGDRVTFHGWQPPHAIGQFYRHSTVVAVPSLWPEPFGMVGPEALAHGRPVVASDTGGIPEWLDHERTGLLVQAGDHRGLADALRMLLGDRALSRRMGEAGAAQVRERYSPAAHAAALERLHTELLAVASNG